MNCIVSPVLILGEKQRQEPDTWEFWEMHGIRDACVKAKRTAIPPPEWPMRTVGKGRKSLLKTEVVAV